MDVQTVTFKEIETVQKRLSAHTGKSVCININLWVHNHGEGPMDQDKLWVLSTIGKMQDCDRYEFSNWASLKYYVDTTISPVEEGLVETE